MSFSTSRLSQGFGDSPELMPAGLLQYLFQLLHDGHGRDGRVQDVGGLSTINCREMTNTEESVCLSGSLPVVCLSDRLVVLVIQHQAINIWRAESDDSRP